MNATWGFGSATLSGERALNRNGNLRGIDCHVVTGTTKRRSSRSVASGFKSEKSFNTKTSGSPFLDGAEFMESTNVFHDSVPDMSKPTKKKTRQQQLRRRNSCSGRMESPRPQQLLLTQDGTDQEVLEAMQKGIRMAGHSSSEDEIMASDSFDELVESRNTHRHDESTEKKKKKKKKKSSKKDDQEQEGTESKKHKKKKKKGRRSVCSVPGDELPPSCSSSKPKSKRTKRRSSLGPGISSRDAEEVHKLNTSRSSARLLSEQFAKDKTADRRKAGKGNDDRTQDTTPTQSTKAESCTSGASGQVPGTKPRAKASRRASFNASVENCVEGRTWIESQIALASVGLKSKKRGLKW